MKRRCISIMVCLVTCVALVGCAAQKPKPAFTTMGPNPKLQSGQLVQKVDSFLIINDLSFSMSDYYGGGVTKLMRAADTIKRLNLTIPDLKMDAALRSFGYVEGGSLRNSKLVYGLTPYTKDGLAASLDNQGRDGGQSPLDMAIDGAAGDLKAAKGRIAVIIVSDGQDMDDAPVQAAERMKGQYGNRLCIYTIQIGDHPSGKKILQRIAEAGGCGFYVSGDDIATSDNMGDFVEKVFLEKAPPVVEKRVEPKAPVKVEAPVQEQKRVAQTAALKEPVTITLDVEFDTGKSNIKARYDNDIKKVADFMTEHPQTIAVIEGHTDNVGSRAKNVRLSQARANNVRNYLVKKFKIKSARLKAKGYGPDKPIADNATVDGRQQNRRVDAVITTAAQAVKSPAVKQSPMQGKKKAVKKKNVKKRSAKKKTVK